MRIIPRSALMFATLALAACGGPSAPPVLGGSSSADRSPAANETQARRPQNVSWISLERTRTASGAAAGPVYVVTLFNDGRVIFEGHASVKAKGTFSKTIPVRDAALVFADIDAINLWERPHRYDVERAERNGDSIILRTASTEVPWDILRARDRGRTIRIDGLFFAPHDILALKTLVEKTVGLTDWVGEPHEWRK